MTVAAKTVEPLLNEYLKTRNEFNEIVSEFAKILVSKVEAYRAKQAEYQKILRELNPPLTVAELREMQLDQKCGQWHPQRISIIQRLSMTGLSLLPNKRLPQK